MARSMHNEGHGKRVHDRSKASTDEPDDRRGFVARHVLPLQ